MNIYYESFYFEKPFQVQLVEHLSKRLTLRSRSSTKPPLLPHRPSPPRGLSGGVGFRQTHINWVINIGVISINLAVRTLRYQRPENSNLRLCVLALCVSAVLGYAMLPHTAGVSEANSAPVGLCWKGGGGYFRAQDLFPWCIREVFCVWIMCICYVNECTVYYVYYSVDVC